MTDEIKTPWQRIQERKSSTQERVFSRGRGATKQINSGRLWFSKRDNKKYNFLVENRTTEKAETKSYSIKVEELIKLTKDGIFHDSLPAMNIAFPFHHQDWMLIRTIDFDGMLERVLELESLLRIAERDED